MELKSYQQATLDWLNRYLSALRAEQAKAARGREIGIEDYDWDAKAWKAVSDRLYVPRRTGDNERVPFACLKIPTGGGKTLLGVRAVDAAGHFRQSQTGLVLWIVPTTQIYNQTLAALKDRAHPYRQQLNLASADRVRIFEKDDTFSPLDVRENLCVLLLMLPSANRQNKETLRMFKDRGGFEAFFPAEDDYDGHAALLGRVPNLDTYGTQSGFFAPVVKSSLGNTLRLLRPIIILDEGHKAYGEVAQGTLFGFNPCFVLELTATPTQGRSNVLVSISGVEVLREGMIKLDLHIRNSPSQDWHAPLRDSHLFRQRLEQIAHDYEQDSGVYIRPINLIQVERTGKDQARGGQNPIHAEDAREFLITQCGVAPHEIAVKSSEKDEIENIDLLSRDCPIRYIITKAALQEGWDCAFAYVLTVLTNVRASTGVTQLVGRILRQPYARKTGIAELDESYVFCFRDAANDMLQAVRRGLNEEGLGDLTMRVQAAAVKGEQLDLEIRQKYIAEVGKVYLPCFLMRDPETRELRRVSYEMDVLSRVDWADMEFGAFETLQLNPENTQDWELRVGIENVMAQGLRVEGAPDMALDPVFMTRQLLDVVPSPWQAYEYVQDVLARLGKRYSRDEIRRDMAFVLNEMKQSVVAQRDRSAYAVFEQLIEGGELQFVLIEGCPANSVPKQIRVNADSRKLRNERDEDLQKSLFDYREDDFNSLERRVALYIDKQDWIHWWHRNDPHVGYGLAGWRRDQVYADFIALSRKFKTVYVLETKGLHLSGNEDTEYKRELFKLCDRLCQPHPRSELAPDLDDENRLHFRLMDEDTWLRVINELAAEGEA
ncbi:MAG: DEAD/DEAH box helicase family protein [Anaerolineae bacterium]